MKLGIILAAYIFSILGGMALARSWVIYLRKGIDPAYDSKTARLPSLDWSIGLIERGITTSLVIWKPSLAPAFVGGWVALKFAANWQIRRSENKEETDRDQENVARKRVAFLIGTAASIFVAVLAGLTVNPGALAN